MVSRARRITMAPTPFDLTVDGVAALATVLSVTRVALQFDTVNLVRWMWTLVVSMSVVLLGITVFMKT